MRTISVVLLSTAVFSLPGQLGDLDRLAWLAGCWERRSDDRVTLEMWMPPAGGMMLGASRTVAGGRVLEHEQLRLQIDAGRIVLIANPSGQTEAAFTATAVGDSGFTVENPDHDFPQLIRYRRRGLDSLVARVEAQGRGFDLPMRRVPCIG